MIEILMIGLAAFLGGVVVDLLGWLESREPFDLRKFTVSVIRSLIASAAIIASSDFVQVTLVVYVLAFMAGAGVDVGIKRVINSKLLTTKK